MKRDTLTTLALILGTVALTYACTEVDDIDDGGDTGAAVTDTGTTDTGSADTGLTEEELCSLAYDDGYVDAFASLGDCACEYEDHWNMDDYESDHLQYCYGQGYWSCYNTVCLEGCKYDEGATCCTDTMDYIVEQMPPWQPGW